MPKVNHVKKAQRRYKMVPVLDENGQPAYRTVQRKRPTKRGEVEELFGIVDECPV